MKTLIVTTLFAAAAGSLLAADVKADLEAAAKKLGDKANYSWTAKTESSGPAEGDRDGKTEKGGRRAACPPRRGATLAAAPAGEARRPH